MLDVAEDSEELETADEADLAVMRMRIHLRMRILLKTVKNKR